MTKIEETKFKSKYNKYLNQIHKVEMQLKHTYSKYYGQIDEEMKGNTHQRHRVWENTPRERRADAEKSAQEHELQQLQEKRGTNQNSVAGG